MMPDWNAGGIDVISLGVWSLTAVAVVAAGLLLIRYYPRAAAATIGAAVLVIAGGMVVTMFAPIEAQEPGDCFCVDVDSTGDLRLGTSSSSDECITFRTSPDQSVCWDDEIKGTVLQSSNRRYSGWTLDAPLTVSINPTGNKDVVIWGVETGQGKGRVGGRLSYIDSSRAFDVYTLAGGTIGPYTNNQTITLGRASVATNTTVAILGSFNVDPATDGTVAGTYEGYLNVGTNATSGGDAMVVDDGFATAAPLLKILTNGANAALEWWDGSARDFGLTRTATDQLTMDGGMQFTPRAGAPWSCATPGGGLYFDTDNDVFCFCQDSGSGFRWEEADGATTCT